MSDVTALWPWLSLAALGAFHGLNPAMGWLFAVALGLQGRRGPARLRGLQGGHPLPPPALGRHAGRSARARRLVVPHGLGARRGIDAGAGAGLPARRGGRER